MKPRTNKEVIRIINQYGKGRLSKPIQEISLKKGYNPFKYLERLPESIVKKINEYSIQHGYSYVCVNPIARKSKCRHNLVIVKCIKTGRLSKPISENHLKKGTNPFKYLERLPKAIAKRVNFYGKGKYICINPHAGKTNHGNNLVIVKCIKTGKLSKPFCEHYLKRGDNPFPKRRTHKEIIQIVNNYAKFYGHKYVCVNPRAGKTKNGNNLVIVKCTKTGRLSKPVQEGGLKTGRSPFTDFKYRIEHFIVRPKAIKIAKSLGFNVKKEYRLGKKEFLDLKLTHPKLNFSIGTELKRSDKLYLSGKDQLIRYKKKFKSKRHNMKYLFFVDPKGRHKKHGFISFKEWKKQLLSLLNCIR